MAVAKGPLEGGREGGRREGGRVGGREGGREGRDNLTYVFAAQHHLYHIKGTEVHETVFLLYTVRISLYAPLSSMLQQLLSLFSGYLSLLLSSPDGLRAGGTDSLSLSEFGSH